MAFASGKRAYGICDISGFRYRLRDMKMTWDGFLVGPDQWEPKQPQLNPPHFSPDAEAIRNPRPQVSSSLVAGEGVVRTIDANSMMTTTGDSIGFAFSMDASTGEIGTVTVVIT